MVCYVFAEQALLNLKVCNPEKVATDEDTRSIHNLNLKVHKDSRVEMCLVLIADGVSIAMKL